MELRPRGRKGRAGPEAARGEGKNRDIVLDSDSENAITTEKKKTMKMDAMNDDSDAAKKKGAAAAAAAAASLPALAERAASDISAMLRPTDLAGDAGRDSAGMPAVVGAGFSRFWGKMRRKSLSMESSTATGMPMLTMPPSSPGARRSSRRNTAMPLLSLTARSRRGGCLGREDAEPDAETPKDACSDYMGDDEDAIIIGTVKKVTKQWSQPKYLVGGSHAIPLHLQDAAWPCKPTPLGPDLSRASREVFIHVLYELILDLLLLPEAVAKKLMANQSVTQKAQLIKQHRQLYTQRDDSHEIHRQPSNGQSGSATNAGPAVSSPSQLATSAHKADTHRHNKPSKHDQDSKQKRHLRQHSGGASYRITLDTGLPLVEYEDLLCESLVRLRTADRVGLQAFVSDNGQALFEMLNFCAFRKPCSDEEMAVIVRSLQCLERITDNHVGIKLVLGYPTTLVTLALCARCELPPRNGKHTPQTSVDCVKNAIISLDILVRLMWGLRGGSRVLMEALEEVAVIRHCAGGALYLFKHDYENTSLADDHPCILVELCLGIFTFLNSLIELEDVIQKRDAIRVDVHRLQLILNASQLATRTATIPWPKLHKNKRLDVLSREVESQLEIFRMREGRDLSVVVEQEPTMEAAPGFWPYGAPTHAKAAKQAPNKQTPNEAPKPKQRDTFRRKQQPSPQAPKAQRHLQKSLSTSISRAARGSARPAGGPLRDESSLTRSMSMAASEPPAVTDAMRSRSSSEGGAHVKRLSRRKAGPGAAGTGLRRKRVPPPRPPPPSSSSSLTRSSSASADSAPASATPPAAEAAGPSLGLGTAAAAATATATTKIAVAAAAAAAARKRVSLRRSRPGRQPLESHGPPSSQHQQGPGVRGRTKGRSGGPTDGHAATAVETQTSSCEEAKLSGPKEVVDLDADDVGGISPIMRQTSRDEERWMSVVRLLAHADLSKYQSAFFDEGFDTIERVREMDSDDFAAVGLKRGHGKSLRKALRTMTERPQHPPPPPTPPRPLRRPSASAKARSEHKEHEQDPGREADREQDGPQRWSKPFGFKVIPHAALIVSDLIGRGSFGDVHLCEYQGGQCVAKKILRVPGVSDEESSHLTNEVILREAETMEMCKNHPHVVSLFGVCLDSPDSLLLISEFCERGSLYEAVVKPRVPAFNLVETLNLAKQGVSGLVHLHSLDVVHRDIAARNFLLDSRGKVKVCDFGLAKIKPSQRNGFLDAPNSNGSSRVNPLRWAAPESLSKHEFSAASDVYMCGVFLWELWMRKQPHAELDLVTAALQVIQGRRPIIDPERRAERPELVELCERCWRQAPAERPSMEEVFAAVRDIHKVYSIKSVPNPNAADNARASPPPRPSVPAAKPHRYRNGL